MSDLERLKVALALYITRKIVNADDQVHEREVEVVSRMFPARKLEELGFMQPGGTRLTDAFHAARREAIEVLPRRLTIPEKEDFVLWFKQVCEADGIVDQREAELVRAAERMLGLRT